MKIVLIIDDDRRRGQYFAEYLELEELTVAWVKGDKEAKEYIERNQSQIGLIVLDILMPSDLYLREETDNFRLTGAVFYERVIRKLLPKVPTIVFSIVNDQALKDKMFSLGVKDWLWKETTTPEKLAEKVKNLLGLTTNF
ncbi:MAG: response regulator [bacterium]